MNQLGGVQSGCGWWQRNCAALFHCLYECTCATCVTSCHDDCNVSDSVQLSRNSTAHSTIWVMARLQQCLEVHQSYPVANMSHGVWSETVRQVSDSIPTHSKPQHSTPRTLCTQARCHASTALPNTAGPSIQAHTTAVRGHAAAAAAVRGHTGRHVRQQLGRVVLEARNTHQLARARLCCRCCWSCCRCNTFTVVCMCASSWAGSFWKRAANCMKPS